MPSDVTIPVLFSVISIPYFLCHSDPSVVERERNLTKISRHYPLWGVVPRNDKKGMCHFNSSSHSVISIPDVCPEPVEG